MNWLKKSEKISYKGWRNMLSKTFQLPNKEIVDYDIVQNGNYVTIAAFTPDKKAILVEQFRPGPEIKMLSFPEGYIDKGEHFLQAAKRELAEETGFKASKLIHLKTIRRAYNTERQYCVLAVDCLPTEKQTLDPDEFIDLQLYSLADLKKILNDPNNQNFANVASTFMALNYLGW